VRTELSAPSVNFSDYHRTVIGFHGTSAEAADRLVVGEPFQESDQSDDWFGRGIYFWEHAFQQAWTWARTYHPTQPAVVGAVLRLGKCFDLLDPGNVSIFRGFHDKMIADLVAANCEVPRNVRSRRNLDCAVFNYLYAEFDAVGQSLDSARAVFLPTASAQRVFQGSWISETTHIQICIRNPECILAVWHVRPDGRYGKPVPVHS
jgi:hypothetical protein